MIMPRTIYWISYDNKVDYRSQHFFNSIESFTDVKVKKLNSVRLLNHYGQHLIFLQTISTCIHKLRKEIPILKKKRLLQKSFILSVDDIPFYENNPIPVIDLTGSQGKHIAGYGFTPNIEGLEHLGENPFKERMNEFRFFGSLHGQPRRSFLRKLHQSCKTNYSVMKGVDFKNKKLPMFFKKFISEPLSFDKYLYDMSLYKFSLVPKGFGHTFRFLESMAMGSVVISDDISDLHFCKDFFTEGHDYLSVGKNFTNLKEVISLCGKPEVESIARNGRETYLKHFSIKRGCLPLSTISPILSDINASIGHKFFQPLKLI